MLSMKIPVKNLISESMMNFLSCSWWSYSESTVTCKWPINNFTSRSSFLNFKRYRFKFCVTIFTICLSFSTLNDRNIEKKMNILLLGSSKTLQKIEKTMPASTRFSIETMALIIPSWLVKMFSSNSTKKITPIVMSILMRVE